MPNQNIFPFTKVPIIYQKEDDDDKNDKNDNDNDQESNDSIQKI